MHIALFLLFIHWVALQYTPQRRFSMTPLRRETTNLAPIFANLHPQGRRIRNIHENCFLYYQRINLLASHRSRESHKERIVTLAFAIRQQTLGKADKRERSNAQSVRSVISVWNSSICARISWCVIPGRIHYNRCLMAYVCVDGRGQTHICSRPFTCLLASKGRQYNTLHEDRNYR